MGSLVALVMAANGWSAAAATTDPSSPPVGDSVQRQAEAPADPATDPAADPSVEPAETPEGETTTPSGPDQVPADGQGESQQTSPPTVPAPDAVAQDVEISPFSVPAPTNTQSVITVKVGGLRTSLTTIGGLAGVTLRLYNGGSGGPNATPRTDAWAVCTSDADGDCSFTVPGTNTGGANRDARFWIKQDGAAPANYLANPTLATGSNPASASYQFRTGTQLRGGTTYTSTQDFMIGSGNAGNISGGVWQESYVNPPRSPQCGADFALILDLSGSVSPYINELRTAASTAVDALTGTPSSVGLFTFAANAPAATGANLPLTPVSTVAGAQTVKNRIATYTANGATNWDRGIYQVAASPTQYDVAVIITDGNPTVYAGSEGPGNVTRFREVENGVFSANALRAQGTRIVAFGVGDGIGGSPDNLKAISGPTAGSDYFQTDDYTEAGQMLRELALGNCVGSMSVVKQVVPSSTTGENIAGAQPAGGWEFTATTSTAGVTPASQNATTASGTGAVTFPLDYPGGVTTASMNVAETPRSGFTLVTQGGKNAVCTNIGTGASVPVTNDPGNPVGFTVDVPSQEAITCTVYNRVVLPQASVTVDKTWEVNGVSYEDGNQPIGLTAGLTLDGAAHPFGQTKGGYTSGDSVAIGETTQITGRDLCTVESQRITEHNGTGVDLPIPSSVTLAAEANHYTITNTVTCGAELTLAKQVQGGPDLPSTWTLTSIGPDGSLPGPSGASGAPGATAPVTPETRYALVEDGSGLYVQTIRPGGNPVLPATGSWQCVQLDANGNPVTGFNDGINGGVIVPLGYRVQCTAVNQTANLTLIKEVVNDDGGTNVPGDWTLTATPSTPAPADVVAQSVPGSSTGQTIQVRPGTTYDLSESGPGGYTQTSMQCTTGPDGALVDAASVTLDPLDEVTCTIVNDDEPVLLTLVKEVDNGTTGATATPTDFTLTADGPDTITGASGEEEVTGVEVSAGAYQLSETGPDGYSSGGWECTGGTLAGDTLTLATGDDATCTVTNTAVGSTLTLVKEVDNGTTGATATPADFLLQATGPDAVSGRGGDASVIAVPVRVGTYDLSESGPEGYDGSAWVCTGSPTSTGTSVTVGLGQDVTCTVTNTARAPHLTLVKEVTNDNGGTLEPSDFTLTATSGAATVSGPSGDEAITDAVVPIGDYTLGETFSDTLGYELASLTCTDGETPLDVDASDPVLGMALGMDVTCTFTNADKPATLTLLKEVDPGASGSTAGPTDWTLTATPDGIGGQEAVSGNGGGGEGGVVEVTVKSGAYALSEDGPSGFDPGEWICQGGVVDDGRVVVPGGGNVVCTITNTAQTPRLTLVKQVQAGDAVGAIASPDAWTLTASGPTPISARTGDTAVTNAPIRIGTYTLSEGGGPSGYSSSAWTCEGGSLDGSSLTVAEGDEVTCVLVNTALPSTWTIEKTSTPPTGSVVAEGDTISYTVTITHTGGIAPTDVEVTDDLTDVLDDATFDDDSIVASTGDAERDGNDLVWTVGTFTGVQTLTYEVAVGDNAGATIRNVVTIPPGAECVGDCETTQYTPAWTLSKSSDPASGSTVSQGAVITYTLTAENTGPVPLTGASARDDLGDVVDNAALVNPLDPALAYDSTTHELTWTIPPVDVGGTATVSYQVRVNDDAHLERLHNVVTPTTPGGECVESCETEHETGLLDLGITKTHAAIEEGSVDSGRGSRVAYTITIENLAEDPASPVTVSDPLPSYLSLVDGTLTLPPGWTSEVVDGTITLRYDGVMNPGDTAEFTYTTTVGNVPRVVPEGAFVPIQNTACVSTSRSDSDPGNDCATDFVTVKSVAIDVTAVCVNDTPIVDYSVTPTNLVGDPVIALIWWTQDAYAARDITIDAGDTEALLADGASQVDRIELPDGWTMGDPIQGSQLWPGAAVDADGNPTAWPGWTQEADGTWVLDPEDPFYDLRGETVVEVRINPTSDEIVLYPPATPNCNANPPSSPPEPPVPPTPGGPVVTPTTTLPVTVVTGTTVKPQAVRHLPVTGAEWSSTAMASALFLLGGLGALVIARRRKTRMVSVRRH